MIKTNKEKIVNNCRELLRAYNAGKMGDCPMPEDTNPGFSENQTEERLGYFTLPMSLNYQRDSYKLWQSALKTYNDKETHDIFSIKESSKLSEVELRERLLKHKLALQPNKHIKTWQTISKTIFNNWGSLNNLFENVENDFCNLKEIVKLKHKKGFPYLSGDKIFNYWSFIISTYGKIPLSNKDKIEIAPDTHVIQCSVLLGVIDQNELSNISREKINERWREVLKDSGINPIDMHSPLWFWSRNNFQYKLL